MRASARGTCPRRAYVGHVEEGVDALELLAEHLSDAHLSQRVSDLVLAAALGDDELASCLGGVRPAASSPAGSHRGVPPAMFLSQITVEGFRGVAGPARLGLRPGPGVTIVVGRNGSGKSSFAEAAELALTGTSSRWEKRSRVWEEGWANLHHVGPRSIEVHLVVDGQPGVVVVRRKWAADGALADGTATAQRPGQQATPLDALGLEPALTTWRPFLSYNELGGLLDEGPSRLYDAISAVLGLEEWTSAEQRLNVARKQLEGVAKAAKTEADRLLRLLADFDDERAKSALAALPPRRAWDLDALGRLALGTEEPPTELAGLEALEALTPLDLHAIAGRAATLREALTAAEAVRRTGCGARSRTRRAPRTSARAPSAPS